MRIVLMIAALGLAGPVAGLSMQPAEQSDLRLVFLSPWADGDALAVQAGGRVVGPARTPLTVLVQADEPAQFDAAARSLGAFWVRDGATLAALCGVSL